MDADDKNIFLQLNKVSGVGAKTALAILGVMNSAEICDAITFEDKASFTRVSGIGPKAAVRIINDLKDKVVKMSVSAEVVSLKNNEKKPVPNSGNQLLKDALSALENLGYQRAHILETVKEVVNDQEDISDVITESLKRLAK